MTDPHVSTGTDFSGRSKLAWNVLTSWLGYFVFVVAGFVMPRVVDHYVGQVSLGVWDFCWSLVNYLSLADIAIGSSVGRYVAKYRTAGDRDGLRRAVSSVAAIQGAIALLVLIGTALLVWQLPRWISATLAEEVTVIRWVIALLGTSVGVHMAADSSRGVITGCHRWDLHNAINATSHLTSVFLMLVALALGGGLVSMAAVYLVIVVATEIYRIRCAYRVCPELSVRARLVDWNNTLTMLGYGGKTTLAGLTSIITLQTASILVAHTLGPAMLAVFARPLALVRHVETFINKFSFVLTPTASSLQASGKTEELRKFYLESTRYGFALAMPMMLVLAVFGDVILKLWMGPRYEQGLTLAILAACYLLPVAQNVSMRIMMGTNSHGRVALLSLVIAMAVFAGVSLYIDGTAWTLERAAFLAGLPLIVANGFVVPFFACRQLGVGPAEYLRNSLTVPVLCNAALLAVLVSARLLWPDHPLLAFGVGTVAGLAMLAILYWFYLLSSGMRLQVGGIFRRSAGC